MRLFYFVQNLLKTLNKETELNTTKSQLKEANKTIQSYKDMDIEAIRQSAEEYKTKYETETKELKDKLDAQKREFAAKEFLDKYDFASERVKKSVLKDFSEKDFKLENGNFLGAEDWMKTLAESEPEIFKTKANNETNTIHFTKTLNDGENVGGTTKKTLSQLMAEKNANPDMEISFE
ncbi:phage scaffolding protein [Clostridium perfringens]